jgi:uncharacterized membrane protein
MYCPNCASQVNNNTKFCTHCGNSLSTQSEQMMSALEKCHSGYLSTVIGLGLVIIALLIVVGSMMFGVTSAAITGLIFLGWAIPAIAQGVSKWLSAKNEMRSILETGPGEGAITDPRGFAGSVTEGTTASLDRRAR